MEAQGTAEWHGERCGFFTASQIHKLLSTGKGGEVFGETALTYILEKIGEKLTGMPVESQDSKATLWGKEQEPLAREWYCRKKGMVVDEVGFIKHPTIPNFGGSPDGITYKVGSGDEAGILEIKCPYTYANHLNHCLIPNQDYFKKYFKEYYWQIVANCLCNNLKWGDFVSFDPRMNQKYGLFTLRIEPPVEDCNLLISRVELANEKMTELISKLQS